MAKEAEREEEEGGEFADFLADVSKEIAQRVESLDARTKQPTPPAVERKKTPIAADPGTIVEWPNIADRMIEEIR